MAYKFFDKKSAGTGATTLANKCQIIYKLQMNFINQLLEKFEKEEFIHLTTIFGV